VAGTRDRDRGTGSRWPGGGRGALCLSFDNLGEAAEIELGALAPDDPSVGTHPTATRVLPELLATLGQHDLTATFFVEGLNAQLYPDALREIVAGGQEVAYHAWRHEQWADLTAAEQADNLKRGLDAFRDLEPGIDLSGLRPPGGQLGEGGLDIPREAGLSYCSPAGVGASIEDGVALLPFQWRHVDATSLLPPLAPIREQITGSPDPLDPATFLTHLEAEIDRLTSEGGFATFVLHLSLIDWLGNENLKLLLNRLSDAQHTDKLWIAPCRDIAGHLLSNPEAFADGATLDPTSWTG